MKWGNYTTDITCPVCGHQIHVPLAVATSPIHDIGELRLDVDPDWTELREHIATHRPDGGGLQEAS